MTMTQMEPSALLIRKQRLDGKATFIPEQGFVQELQVAHQTQRLFLPFGPDRYQEKWAKTPLGIEDVFQFEAVAGLEGKPGQRVPVCRVGKDRVFGNPTNKMPAQPGDLIAQVHPVELAVPQKDDRAFCGDYLGGLLKQSQVGLFRQVAAIFPRTTVQHSGIARFW